MSKPGPPRNSHRSPRHFTNEQAGGDSGESLRRRNFRLPPPWRTPPGLISWILAVTVWLAWAPFRLRSGPANYQWEPNLDPETLSHLGLLIPLAVVFAATGNRASSRRPLIAGLAVAGIALILEVGQWWLEVRSVSPWDLAAGWIGGFAAIVLTRVALRAGAPARAIVWGLALAVFTLVAITVNLNVRRQNAGLRIEDWNPRFRVVEADEWGGRRSYDGDVSDGRICAGEGDDRFCILPGASLVERSKLVDLAERTQIVDLSAWVRSNSDHQKGPARILTFSAGPYGRNVTLAQSGTSLVFRLRSPRGGPNGVWHQFSLRDAVPIGRTVRVEGAFRRGIVRLASSGSSTLRQGKFGAPFHGTLHVRGKTRLNAALVFHGRALLAGTLAFLAGTGFFFGLFSGGRLLVLVPAAIGLSVAILWALTAGIWNAAQPTGGQYLLTAAVVVAGALAGRWDRIRLGAASSG